MYVDVKEVMRTLGISRGKAYKIIQQLNAVVKLLPQPPFLFAITKILPMIILLMGGAKF